MYQQKIREHPLFPAVFAGDSALIGKLSSLLTSLFEANEKFNLTAITDPDAAVAKHILDSLVAAEALSARNAGGTLLDVGSGAGFPALPIAAALPHLSVTALDATAKKATYMNGAAAEAGIRNFTAISGRAEDLSRRPEHREGFDFVTARAVANLPVLAELCLPFLKVGGIFLALKGENAPTEAKAAKNALFRLGGKLEEMAEYSIPGDEKPRYLLTIRKVSPTPAAYPRHFSQIAKKPL